MTCLRREDRFLYQTRKLPNSARWTSWLTEHVTLLSSSVITPMSWDLASELLLSEGQLLELDTTFAETLAVACSTLKFGTLATELFYAFSFPLFFRLNSVVSGPRAWFRTFGLAVGRSPHVQEVVGLRLGGVTTTELSSSVSLTTFWGPCLLGCTGTF